MTDPISTHGAGAESGDSEAQWQLASAFYYGTGIGRDFAEALRYGLMAAKAGHAAAQNLVGWMYSAGEGVAVDHKASLQWVEKAAAQGHAQANQNMGGCPLPLTFALDCAYIFLAFQVFGMSLERMGSRRTSLRPKSTTQQPLPRD